MWEDNTKIKQIGWKGMVFIDLAVGRDGWRAYVNKKLTFGFYKMWGIS